MGNPRPNEVDLLVSRRLRTRRIELGLSQNDLANAVDVSIQQVQKYENAANRISSGKLYIFAKFLKVPVSYFFQSTSRKEEEFDPSNYEVPEKEYITLVKAFSKVENAKTRKAILTLARSLLEIKG